MLRKAALVFSFLSICSVTLSRAAEAPPAVKVYRVGVLAGGSAAEFASSIGAFREVLRERGWVGKLEITFHERYADGRYERLPQFAAELVALKVDLILTVGTPSTEAAMKATREIPIVFPVVADPVGRKMVQTLAHPGGNVTGVSIMGPEIAAKQLELVREAVPGVKRVGLLINSASPATIDLVPVSQAASRSLGIQLEIFDIRDFEDFAKAFVKISAAGVEALIISDDSVLNEHLEHVGELALRYRLPVIAVYALTGVLLSYTTNFIEHYRRSAYYVDKILRGAKPGDLPVEQPRNFLLVLNLKTAKSLGLTIPKSILLRADEVIQ